MNLKQIIKNHEPFDELEERDKASFLQFLNNFSEERQGSRKNLIGHLTASCWIVNKERTAVIMAHHNIYNTWAWLGGHADGDLDLLNVAKKEAMEESGLSFVKPLIKVPIDLTVLSVLKHTKNGRIVPEHLHFNATYLLEGDINEKLIYAPKESSGVKWIKNKEIPNMIFNRHIGDIYKRIMGKVK